MLKNELPTKRGLNVKYRPLGQICMYPFSALIRARPRALVAPTRATLSMFLLASGSVRAGQELKFSAGTEDRRERTVPKPRQKKKKKIQYHNCGPSDKRDTRSNLRDSR